MGSDLVNCVLSCVGFDRSGTNLWGQSIFCWKPYKFHCIRLAQKSHCSTICISFCYVNKKKTCKKKSCSNSQLRHIVLAVLFHQIGKDNAILCCCCPQFPVFFFFFFFFFFFTVKRYHMSENGVDPNPAASNLMVLIQTANYKIVRCPSLDIHCIETYLKKK